MKSLTWHIVKKDFRHLWPWLALWWVTFIVAAVYPAWAFHKFMHSASMNAETSFSIFGAFASVILLLVIVASLVDADTPLDDRALWRTQPVPPARLFAAKITFLLLFGLLAPLLIKFIALAAYGFSFAEGWPAFQNFALILIYGNVVLLLAASFFVRPIIGYAVLISLYLLAAFTISTFNRVGRDSASPPVGILIPLSLFLAILLTAIACIYLQQRRRNAIRVLVCGLVLAYILARFWPSGGIAYPAYFPPTVLASFPLEMKSGHFVTDTYADDKKAYHVVGNLSPDSLPVQQPAEVWIPLASIGNFSWPDHTPRSERIITTYGRPQVFPANFPALGFPLRFAEALEPFGVKHLLTTLSYDSLDLGQLEPTTFQHLQQSPATLTGNLTFAAGRLEEVGRLPLLPGSILRHGPTVIGMISADQSLGDSTMVTVTVAEQFPDPIGDQRWYDGLEFNLLVNLQRGEAIIGYPNGVNVTSLNDFRLQRTGLAFRFQYFTGPGKVYDIPDSEIKAWLADAQFLRLRFVPLGTQLGTFTLPDLHAN
jgi:hypothetical protein